MEVSRERNFVNSKKYLNFPIVIARKFRENGAVFFVKLKENGNFHFPLEKPLGNCPFPPNFQHKEHGEISQFFAAYKPACLKILTFVTKKLDIPKHL